MEQNKIEIEIGQVYLAVLARIKHDIPKITPVIVEGLHQSGGYIVRNTITHRLHRIKNLWRFKRLWPKHLVNN